MGKTHEICTRHELRIITQALPQGRRLDVREGRPCAWVASMMGLPCASHWLEASRLVKIGHLHWHRTRTGSKDPLQIAEHPLHQFDEVMQWDYLATMRTLQQLTDSQVPGNIQLVMMNIVMMPKAYESQINTGLIWSTRRQPPGFVPALLHLGQTNNEVNW